MAVKKAKKEKAEISSGLKKTITSHIKQDSKEFRAQLADDRKLKKKIKSAKKT